MSDNEGGEDEDEVEKVVDEISHCYLVYQGGHISVSAVVDDGDQEEERRDEEERRIQNLGDFLFNYTTE